MPRLIDQLLDFRSAELGNIKLNEAHADLVQCVRESVQLIKPLADERAQTLSLDLRAESYLAWFDAEKIDKILSNLISNAIKYTDPNGRIVVTLEIENEGKAPTVSLSVEDDGPGIPKSKTESIFEIFYRIGNQRDFRVRGSGIGLAYTKNLVEACSGSITVESPVAKVNGQDRGSRSHPNRHHDAHHGWQGTMQAIEILPDHLPYSRYHAPCPEVGRSRARRTRADFKIVLISKWKLAGIESDSISLSSTKAKSSSSS